jgi:hypothetical protein
MNAYQKVLLMIGSPKGSASSSASLGNYLIHKLEENSLKSEVIHIHKLIKNKKGKLKLLSMMDEVDLIVLAFPLYVDSLPAPVIKVMESIAESRKKLEKSIQQAFSIIVNCGFPEVEQNDIAIGICEIFAKEVGFQWKGGLALGMGPILRGKPLKDRGRVVRHIVNGLDLAADALSKGQEIPKEAKDSLAKRSMPKILYTKVGNLGWKMQAKKYNAKSKMYDKPYA